MTLRIWILKDLKWEQVNCQKNKTTWLIKLMEWDGNSKSFLKANRTKTKTRLWIYKHSWLHLKINWEHLWEAQCRTRKKAKALMNSILAVMLTVMMSLMSTLIEQHYKLSQKRKDKRLSWMIQRHMRPWKQSLKN